MACAAVTCVLGSRCDRPLASLRPACPLAKTAKTINMNIQKSKNRFIFPALLFSVKKIMSNVNPFCPIHYIFGKNTKKVKIAICLLIFRPRLSHASSYPLLTLFLPSGSFWHMHFAAGGCHTQGKYLVCREERRGSLPTPDCGLRPCQGLIALRA